MPADQLFDMSSIEIPDGDYRHEIRPVPSPVKPAERFVPEVIENRFLADGEAFRVARIFEKNRELFVPHPRPGSPADPPFFNDHSALLVDLIIIETDRVDPVFHDLE